MLHMLHITHNKHMFQISTFFIINIYKYGHYAYCTIYNCGCVLYVLLKFNCIKNMFLELYENIISIIYDF